MVSHRSKMNCPRIASIAMLLLLVQQGYCSPQRSGPVHGRYIRPSAPDRDYPKCTSSRCSDDLDKDRGTHTADGYSDDGYKSDSSSDYKPKDEEYVGDSYNPKPKDDYAPNPGAGDYDRNPTHQPKPVIRDDYNVKPVVRDEYKPKPPIRVDYNSKPAVIDEYPAKPSIVDDYKPKPPVRADYNPKPVDDYRPSRDDYEPKPAVVDEYKPKPPVRVGYNSRPVNREEHKPKPAIRDDYDSKPAVVDEYKPKPPVRVDYNSRPVNRDEHKPKPVIRDDYPKPAVVDEYKPKPPVRVDYNSRPVNRDEYKPEIREDYPKPAVVDEYKPKPPVRVDYNSRPVNRDEHKPKPVIRDDYPKPAVVDEYKPKPPVRVDYNSRPVNRDEHKPKPARDVYTPRPSGYGGGYGGSHPVYPAKKDEDAKITEIGDDKTKDDDYNDDFKEDYDKGDGRPVPIAEDKNCICVPYYQCTDGHIVTDGAGIIDARRRPQADEELPLDGKFKPPSCGPFHVCCDTPESSTVKPYEHRCGVRNPSGINSRILSPSNKGEADFGEWPWQAAVLKTEGPVNIFQCGGVLIDKYHVLTVAHCVFHLYKYNDYPLKVRLGEWDTQTTSEFLSHEDYKVTKIIIHPEFRNTSLWNDIAILRLQDPVLFAPHIDTVCLPKYDENFAGQNCIVTGWGKDSYKGGTFSNVMKEVALQVIDNYGCEEMLRKTRLGSFFQLHEGFVCAGGEHGLDSCKGDGGGPLVCYRKDRSYALAGLVSWGIDCGQPGVPGVYVKVQKYLEWISKSTGVDLQDYWPKH